MSIDATTANMRLTCSLELPANYRTYDILAFHTRDSLAIAESAQDSTFQKGLLWNNYPACLTIKFNPYHADVELAIDGLTAMNNTEILINKVRRMLGLIQAVEDFEQKYWQHPQLGKLIAKQSGLRIPMTVTVFEALSWAIIGQQISVHAATSIRRRLIQAANISHSGGLLCYPNAEQVAELNENDLRQTGLSLSKARTLLIISRMLSNGELFLENRLETLPIEEMQQKLSKIRGIGPWTINYLSLRGYGWLDASLEGDVAVRRGLQKLINAPDKITAQQTQQWLAPFSPWRALVAAHLWMFSNSEV